MKTSPFYRRFGIIAIVVSLLVAHGALSFLSVRDASPAFDELQHISSGLIFWTAADFRFHPDNGNLPQRWCALPLVLRGVKCPHDPSAWERADSYLLGQKLLYESEHDPRAILAWARAMAMVWSIALCIVIFLWSRRIYGTNAGIVSFALAAFWPAIVAHGPLATSDICGTLFFTLSAWLLWELVNRVTTVGLLAATVSVGLAAVAKHSCILLAPLFLVFVAIVLASNRPIPLRIGRWSAEATTLSCRVLLLGSALLVFLAAALVFIWASFAFRYLPTPGLHNGLDYYWFDSLAECVVHGGGLGSACDVVASLRVLPEAWLWGVSYMAARSGHRYAFAAGAHSVYGWWWYFPLCLGIKNTLPSLLLCGLGLWNAAMKIFAEFAAKRPLDGPVWNSIPPIVVLCLLWPIFLTSHLNIGERHILPSYPPLVVLAGGVWRAAPSVRSKGTVVFLIVLHALDITSHMPSPLAYFNQSVARKQGYKWLVDSNLDWGQDLRRLRLWLERNAAADERLYVTYAGVAPVETELPVVEKLGFPRGWGVRQQLLPGLYCVSATALQGVADRPRGRWCQTFERDYQAAAAWLMRHEIAPDAPQADVSARQLLAAITRDRDELGVLSLGTPPSDGALAVAAFNILQAGRLKAFLRHRPPDAVIGGSILVFRLAAADIEQALHGPPAELAAHSWFERERYGTADELVRQGRRHLDGDRPEEALAVFESATRLYPGDPRAWDGLAVACRSLGDDDRAMRAERRCERIRARLAAGGAER